MQKEENNRPNIEKENRSIERNYINDRISWQRHFKNYCNCISQDQESRRKIVPVK
jgi:hypothetical protein